MLKFFAHFQKQLPTLLYISCLWCIYIKCTVPLFHLIITILYYLDSSLLVNIRKETHNKRLYVNMAFPAYNTGCVEETEASAIMWSGLSEGGGGIATLFSKLCHTFLAFIPETVNSLSVQMKTVICEWTMPGSGPHTLRWLTVNTTTVGLDNLKGLWPSNQPVWLYSLYFFWMNKWIFGENWIEVS